MRLQLVPAPDPRTIITARMMWWLLGGTKGPPSPVMRELLSDTLTEVSCPQCHRGVGQSCMSDQGAEFECEVHLGRLRDYKTRRRDL